MRDARRDVTRLSELVGLGDLARLRIDWDGLADELGHQFPADYRQYVESFPPGDIGMLNVLHPKLGAGHREYVDTIRNQQEYLDDARAVVAGKFPYRFGSNEGQLAIWGAVQADFLLCWQMTGDDPDTWPTVVVDTNLSANAVERYDGPAIELLIDIAEGRDPVSLIAYVTEGLPFRFKRIGEAW